MPAVNVKNVTLGKGTPKICVPLTGKTIAGIRDELLQMNTAVFDLIEWRADKFEALHDPESLSAAAAAIHEAFPDKPLIFTIRTKNDMEDFEISDSDYQKINYYVSERRLADLIDLEFSRGSGFVYDFINSARPHGTGFICSRHLKDSTPSVEDMLQMLSKMAGTGADLLKLAVMPQSAGDVLALMEATRQFSDNCPDLPVITMSMGRLGILSRISGKLTGSCLTFGTAVAASAPGQPDCRQLKKILDFLTPDNNC